MLGIITTASFFYIGWGSIALRAYRVKAVFDTYDSYLKALADKDNSKKDSKHENLLSLVTYNYDEYDMTSPLPKRLSPRNNEKKELKKGEQLDRLGKLREWVLIKKFAIFFILPNLVLGFAALFSKYFYILVPIYETDQCKCKFVLPQDDCFITNFNVSLFFFVNWL